MSAFWRNVLIIFIVFNVLIGLIVFARMLFWTHNNPPKLMGAKFMSKFIFKLIYILFDTWSEITFWIIFFASFWWFVVYKMQENAYNLLPSLDTWATDEVRF